MRLTLFQRIPISKALIFTLVLVLVELVEGTDPIFAFLVFCYFMLSVLAFNVAGGLTRPSGAYILFYSVLVAGVGLVYKALMGQPAQTHLYTPVLVMGVYTATVAAMLIAAFVTRKFVTTMDGVAGVLHVPRMDLNTSALGCVVIVFLINNAFSIFAGGNGTILHAIAMVNYFLPLSILLGTAAAVRNSNGRRSTSPLTLTALAYSTVYGLLSFSKQGMFSPFVCWVLGLAWAGFRLRLRHVVAIVVFSVIAQEFMVPLANIGRGEAGGAPNEVRLAVVEDHILHPLKLKQMNTERAAGYSGLDIWYYGSPQGIFDRFTMLPNDSQLIGYSASGHFYGYLPLIYYFENWVPHILFPNKLQGIVLGGNVYAHELGYVADDDWTTGISFSPSAEAYHLDGWTCVLAIQPFIFLIVFASTDAVCGDIRSQPWGLLPMLLFAHIAPEGLLAASINYVWMGNVGTIFAIFVSGYVTPVFGRLLRGRTRDPLWRSNVPITVGSLSDAF